ncbi:hypothetical protein XENORESO_015107, partial [Xenotaenia resolanae]
LEEGFLHKTPEAICCREVSSLLLEDLTAERTRTDSRRGTEREDLRRQRRKQDGEKALEEQLFPDEKKPSSQPEFLV